MVLPYYRAEYSVCRNDTELYASRIILSISYKVWFLLYLTND